MANENKDFANSVNKISDGINKANNLVLDNANKINDWYSKNINEMLENEIESKRLETNIENEIKEDVEVEDKENIKIETKVSKYDEMQTNKSNNTNLKVNNRLNTKTDSKEIVKVADNEEIGKLNNKLSKVNKITGGIKTGIKSVKTVNNGVNKLVKTGKSINTGLNESGLKSFENSSNRIMTKPIKKVASKATSKVTKEVNKQTKKIIKKSSKKIAKTTKNLVTNATHVMMKIIEETTKMILSMLPSIAPVLIIILAIAAIGNFFNFKSSKEADNMDFDEMSKMIIEIEDENLQAIYNEFLKNMGKPYLMDHSNLEYEECMEYYDCSSWTIHCLAHAGIKTIANTGASGLYSGHCNPVEVNDRKPMDLIFLKDTYDTGEPGSISHVGIYMGELTVNGETAEWVIDTGGNPEGVKIRKYNNGWWNGEHFYGFGRLK